MQSDPFIGQSLGPYKVLEKIAHGGMGDIYKGIHAALDRYVAIKLLSRTVKADPALTQRFQREAKAAAGLRHPNIVQVFDFGAQRDVYYLVMEYVKGIDLPFGTPEYIAPEQAIDSRAAIPQSVIYSLGGILYEMVIGHLPFEAESSISLAVKHINEDPTPPRQYTPDMPKAVEAVILQALAKEPAKRFATARATVDALSKAGDPASPFAKPTHSEAGLVPPPRPSATGEATWSTPAEPQRRWPLVASLAAILLTREATGTSTATLPPSPSATPSLMATATAQPTNTPRPTPTATATLVPRQALARSLDGMAMCFVPGGPFLVGTDDPDAPDREKPVGSYPKGASAYDILDLAGNVWEWVADWYDPSYYGTVQPGVLEPMGPLSGSERVTRGGSVGYGSNEARTAYRTSGNPEKARRDGLGFRGAVSGDWLP